jgi:hypothetical protein
MASSTSADTSASDSAEPTAPVDPMCFEVECMECHRFGVIFHVDDTHFHIGHKGLGDSGTTCLVPLNPE